MEKEALRNALPEAARPLFDDIVVPRVLGASAHIDRISQIVGEIGRQDSSPAGLILINQLLDYCCATRGQSSYAIINAVSELSARIQTQLPADFEVGRAVQAAVEQFQSAGRAHRQAIIATASALLKNCRKILLYDYSSTVDAVVQQLASDTEIVIAESRTISGGLPFVKTCVQTHQSVSFIPDAALCQGLKGCDAVLIGAETFYPDGTALNTAGSEMAALLAHWQHVPYYVLTTAQKADMRALQGGGKVIEPKDLRFKMAAGMAEADAERLDFHVQGCVPIAPEFITAYITELGVLPPAALFSALWAWKPEYFRRREETE